MSGARDREKNTLKPIEKLILNTSHMVWFFIEKRQKGNEFNSRSANVADSTDSADKGDDVDASVRK